MQRVPPKAVSVDPLPHEIFQDVPHCHKMRGPPCAHRLGGPHPVPDPACPLIRGSCPRIEGDPPLIVPWGYLPWIFLRGPPCEKEGGGTPVGWGRPAPAPHKIFQRDHDRDRKPDPDQSNFDFLFRSDRDFLFSIKSRLNFFCQTLIEKRWLKFPFRRGSGLRICVHLVNFLQPLFD